jgi:hypothetical protein
MRIRRLKKLVRVMQALPDDIKNREALKNINVPPNKSFDFRFNLFAGLISIVADDIPALKKYYTREDKYDSNGEVVLNPYSDYTTLWEWALRRYLGVDLAKWASFNSELWGNDKMRKSPWCYREGFSRLTFDIKGSEALFNYHIIDHLAGVCERIDNLSLKQKIPLVYDNIGGRAGVFVMLIAWAFVAANVFPYGWSHFIALWLSLTAINLFYVFYMY